jgi:hypothetical protein
MEIVAFHRSDLWITCALDYRDWRAPQWAPGHYSVRFFHDEAVALAAGHRPCALCRRPAYQAFRSAVTAAAGSRRPNAKELDRTLHAERLVRGTHRRRLHSRTWPELPDGTFVLLPDGPALVLAEALVPWTKHGYTRPRPRPSVGQAQVITPPSSVAAIAAGYPVHIDASARQPAGIYLRRIASGPTSDSEA